MYSSVAAPARVPAFVSSRIVSYKRSWSEKNTYD